jgi:hypothetical protein
MRKVLLLVQLMIAAHHAMRESIVNARTESDHGIAKPALPCFGLG